MKKKWIGALVVALWAGIGMPAESPAQTGQGHPFACADYYQGKVFIVSAQGQVEWEYKAGSCADLWVLPNGNLLFNTHFGVAEVTRDKKIVFNYTGSPVKHNVKQKDGSLKEEESPSEVFTCQRLANGNTFVGECNTGRLLEVAPDGKTIVKEVRLLPEGANGGHGFMRNARVLANGNYLVAHMDSRVVKEYDPNGNVVRKIPTKGGPYSAVRLPDGNTLIACGEGPSKAQVFEVDQGGRVVWEITNDDLPGIQLAFMTGLQRLPNGNTVMSNWLGHGKFGQAPHVIEVTRDKKVVWTFADHKAVSTVSSIQVLDVPGDPIKGEVLH